jgi:hypothetical protein
MLPRMSLRLLWVVALGSPLVACYAFLSFIYYAWLTAFPKANLDSLSLRAGIAFAVFLVVLLGTVVGIVGLLRHYNSLPRLPERDPIA